ncbi:MAG: DUF3078 domain-containing protein [Rikenellaceae bacterium]
MSFRLKEIAIFVIMVVVPLMGYAQIDDIYDAPIINRHGVAIPMSQVRGTSRLESNRYHSAARAQYLRDSTRKARNTLTIASSLKGTVTAMNDPWIDASGGDNTVALTATFSLEHKYSYNKFEITNKISTKFGYNRIDIEVTNDDGETNDVPTWFKNQDEITLSTAPSIKITDSWSYGITGTFRSQFAYGYVSRSQQERTQLKSSFMAPGYLDISGGMTYNLSSENWPFKFTLSPLSMSAIYVTNEEVKQNILYQYEEHIEDNYKYSEVYGVDPLLNSEYEGGSSLQVDFTRYLDKKKVVEYTSMLYLFYGWMTQATSENKYRNYDDYEDALEVWSDTQTGIKPTLSILPAVRWENTIKIKATEYLSTQIDFKLYYNRSIERELQTYTYLDVGLTYTFKNK